MRAHLLQLDIAWEDKPESRRRADALLADARVGPGDLVLLPEMFETGFSMRLEQNADDGAGAAWLAERARRHRVTLLAGITAALPGGRGRNRALAFSPAGDEIARYDKVHPFSFGREHERIDGGDHVVVFPWRDASGAEVARIAPVVCYDLRFPELFRAARATGAEVFAVLANWPAERADHWRTLLHARAIENQAYVLGVNRVGADPNVKHHGGSLIVGPRGETVAEAGSAPCALSASLDLQVFREWRARFPAWADARRGLLPRLGPDGRFDPAVVGPGEGRRSG